ncbi:cyclin-domain-containing protein [Halteromyces radiatus]|uniref:cyclin-domain-containing protein n=1 Tax=Halteromyces radiatus TaxID=101107 RepID=UPI00221F8ED4|nr:cyclin-domain-containing protein [Halteromyces radiatus]KAI8077685.1 cyclin-domain-containing protein [Halteromyces radiatus]
MTLPSSNHIHISPYYTLHSNLQGSTTKNYNHFLPTRIHPTQNLDFIDRLVDTSAEIIDSIWQPSYNEQSSHLKVVSTKTFIQEILRRSKTTYSNLQVCLFYLFRVKKMIIHHLMNNNDKKKTLHESIIGCGRRMFLASLMVSAKFLQDKNYRNRAWARISGLSLTEINAAERVFLNLINYNLYINKSTFDQWYCLLQSYLYQKQQTYLLPPLTFSNHNNPRYDYYHHESTPALEPCLSSSPQSSPSLPPSPTCIKCYLQSVSSPDRSYYPSPPNSDIIDGSHINKKNGCGIKRYLDDDQEEQLSVKRFHHNS